MLRAVMILVDAWLIARFHWMLYLFGALLVFTGVKMWTATGQEPDLEADPALRWIRGHMRISPDHDGEKSFTAYDGARTATPLFVVILLTGIVMTSNAFAILGLRAMHFLLAGMHERFHLLPYGLAIVPVPVSAPRCCWTTSAGPR